MSSTLLFNSERDIAFAHQDRRFDNVLHVMHSDWHGIRSASACLPGHKMAISHEGGLNGEFFRHAIGLIVARRIRTVCLQGLSANAFDLAETLRSDFGSSLRIVAVTHVTAAQFENFFEIQMQKRLFDTLQRGIIDRIGSVKPHFHRAFPLYWPRTIFNPAPDIARFRAGQHDPEAVFVPVENTWRKNLYSNILGACSLSELRHVFAVNRPTGLELLADISKLRLSGYLRGMNLYAFMGSVAALLNVTLAECQPMTQLEALAMGTPCLTGPLALPGFATHPMTRLTEVHRLDAPDAIADALRELLLERRRDPKGFVAMLDDYLDRRNAACFSSYLEFFEG
jgi:hypothetical protein